jgi:ArsR family transcriptional regulator
MNELTDLFKVLSDETRLRLVNLLFRQKLCVCELVEILELSQPKISKHIAKLRSINLVKTERSEQYIYYSYNNKNTAYNRIIFETMITQNETLQNDLANMDKVRPFVCTT